MMTGQVSEDYGVLSQNAWTQFYHEKQQITQTEDILENNWPGPIKNITVMKGKGLECHRLKDTKETW